MSYPNYYQNYQPQYQQQYQQPQQIQAPLAQNQILAWVQSEEEAKNYPLGLGQSIFLMNQREPYLYMKAVDQLGKVTFLKKRLLDESENTEPKVDLKDYIRKEEIEDIISDLIQKEVERKMSEISFKPTRSKKIVEED